MKWGLKNQEYNLVKFIYIEMNFGIPVKYLYYLPEKNYFNNLSNFLSNSQHNIRTVYDDTMLDIIYNFKISKYQKLAEWNNSYGYKYLY